MDNIMFDDKRVICGIDEAGRGSLAGSLFVCGVLCKASDLSGISGINDSKKLSRKTRDSIAQKAVRAGIPHLVCQYSASDIDSRGISQCLKDALERIMAHFDAEIYAFDGNTSFGVAGIRTIIKGDSKIPQISLASIIAKSHKDAECDMLDRQYPAYNLAKHKGYGTLAHREAIAKYGFSPIHRRSFAIKSLQSEQSLF